MFVARKDGKPLEFNEDRGLALYLVLEFQREFERIDLGINPVRRVGDYLDVLVDRYTVRGVPEERVLAAIDKFGYKPLEKPTPSSRQ